MRAGMKGSGGTGMKGFLGLVLVAGAIAGCGADAPPPAPLPGEEIFVTMQGPLPLDHVMELLPNGGITPSAEVSESSIVHGYMVDRYLVDGAMIAIVWVHDPATGYPEGGDLRAKVTPVIFKSDYMDGWGWDHLDLRAAEWGVVDRSKSVDLPVDPISPADGTDTDGADGQDPNTQASTAEVDSGVGSEDSETLSF